MKPNWLTNKVIDIAIRLQNADKKLLDVDKSDIGYFLLRVARLKGEIISYYQGVEYAKKYC